MWGGGGIGAQQRQAAGRDRARRPRSIRLRNHCNRCAAGCCAPTTGSALASAVRVLLRSAGSSSPARYWRKPSRWLARVNRSSNWAAYVSKGSGIGGTTSMAGTSVRKPRTSVQAVNKVPLRRHRGHMEQGASSDAPRSTRIAGICG